VLKVTGLKENESVIMVVPVGRAKLSSAEPRVAPLLASSVALTVNSPSHVYPSLTPTWYDCVHAVIV
jgi:hypothetical protein